MYKFMTSIMCLRIIFVEARTKFDVLWLKLKLKAIQYKSSAQHSLCVTIYFVFLTLWTFRFHPFCIPFDFPFVSITQFVCVVIFAGFIRLACERRNEEKKTARKLYFAIFDTSRFILCRSFQQFVIQ